MKHPLNYLEEKEQEKHQLKDAEPLQKRQRREECNGVQGKAEHLNGAAVTAAGTAALVSLKADADYFRGYSTIHIHEEMLTDQIRTNAYKHALYENAKHLRGSTVMDVGAGTGILSIFAVQAGVNKALAVEACEIAEQARLIVKENKMEDKIDIIKKTVEEFELTEKVDAIISEWMGYCLLYETMLPSVLRARDKFLKEGGLMFPSKATLYLAPVHDEDLLKRVNFWNEIENKYQVSMKCMKSIAEATFTADADIRVIPPEAVQAHAADLCSLDLMTATPEDVQSVKSSFQFKCFGHTIINGFISWFTVEFPGGRILSTSPYKEATHWAHTVFSLQKPFPVRQDTEINGIFSLKPHPRNHRCVEVEIAFTVDNQESQRQTFSLHNTCPGRQLHNEDRLIPDLPRKTLDCTKSSLENGGSSPIQERSSKYGKKNSNAMKIY
ncbi:protein arginine N-methyltransferase 6-like isoform X2 [Pomacea canaliculata]|uniref:protein arginine N-methyltransferase 6-like isoform X2 n=1 Tax=Pomacea canaliculata TaxID=400727 RepID=UPI000D7335E1|nr:protein arginine N-methyltransferase 6-like isoform X2 [Pomacea canaliculata]